MTHTTYHDSDIIVNGSSDLSDRHALRRVTGLTTELTDITDVEVRQLRLERVVLVGIWTRGTAAQAEEALRELAALADTAGAEVVDGIMQRRSAPDSATYIGSGKAAELAALVTHTRADTVICDGELTPAQLSALERLLNVKVIDRTALILDIFAQHARSKEGKAQIELAQMEYMLPRLRGWGQTLSRQAGGRAGSNGGVGLRGPGETKIETDRRRIRYRISQLRKQIKHAKGARTTQRAQRARTGTPSVAIAGYTNAGKSSLLNQLTDASVLVEDALFATLDPTVRAATTPSGRQYTLTDTVGFVQHLPHQLVEAFRSTLEEVASANLIVHLVDSAAVNSEDHIVAVRSALADAGAQRVPELLVLNKIDQLSTEERAALTQRFGDAVCVSAATGDGISELRERIEDELAHGDAHVTLRIPYAREELVARIYSRGSVESVKHTSEGTEITAAVPHELVEQLVPFVVR